MHANPALAKIFGYDSMESFMQVPIADTYLDPEERKMFIAEITEKGSVRDKPFRLRRKDGTPILGFFNGDRPFRYKRRDRLD